jgi:hypothetical protein
MRFSHSDVNALHEAGDGIAGFINLTELCCSKKRKCPAMPSPALWAFGAKLNVSRSLAIPPLPC